ncbi:MAG: hypothetical protein O6922_06945 [Chloroflexi bacterium]|nr:hypothetical protein [Chloroflexota bacterium]
MPDWLLEALLPAVVFGGLFIMWVMIPAPKSDDEGEGEPDFASRLRARFRK